MPVVKCQCGAETNSAVSLYWTRKNWNVDQAEGCFVRWVDDHWEKGCLYAETTPTSFMRQIADKMIKEERHDR